MLAVEGRTVRPLLAELAEAKLDAFGLYADDVQAQIAVWLSENGS